MPTLVHPRRNRDGEPECPGADPEVANGCPAPRGEVTDAEGGVRHRREEMRPALGLATPPPAERITHALSVERCLRLEDFADELVERLAVRARRPLLGCASRTRLRGIAEGDDRLDLAAADLGGGFGVADPIRARADAFRPSGQHH